ncbi:hypothetical protein ERJ75_001335700 [Trypanosoma vivax]|uniref:Uncharacterized protein n=1 Tax=Trypanosoma vivax (strain Y486) TaxID=1055687 RepID=G0U642_TRYVY|nr:hypothetical protein TRVL_07925 [Trypanosoma vivax]KAH8607924.1 hypothetical protein ERJ75_001335700 [Trypanosoma vivax]CCC51344.1 conserved hypothetical protein [Trypanosoma vivax Y486]
MVGGFTEWAHLRLRDHRPGPTSYVVPAPPSSQRSMLGKLPIREDGPTVGPGEYHIPSTIGTGRAATFGPPDGPHTPSGSLTPSKSPKRRHLKRKPRRSLLQDAKKLADAPAFSMGCKLKDPQSCCPVGPGEYEIPSQFGAPGKGPTFGKRTMIPTTRDDVPGPASYSMPPFDYEKPKTREVVTSMQRLQRTDTGPGPGSYDDPTTIAARFAPPARRLCDAARFGGRTSSMWSCLHRGPGPSEYGDVSRIATKGPTHTPVFREPMSKNQSKAPGTPRGKYLPAMDSMLPSDFDYIPNKGVSFGSRTWKPLGSAATGKLGPGEYNLGKPPMTSNGFRFALQPYDPYAIDKAACSAQNSPQAASGPSMYHPNLDAVRPSRLRGVGVFGIGERFTEPQQPGSHCYNLRPLSPGRGTVFYRGDYSRSTYMKKEKGNGPAYNVENNTIMEGVRQGKGVTFGIRYPARATHQVCKPYDETTNINCVYGDEMTWLVKRP